MEIEVVEKILKDSYPCLTQEAIYAFGSRDGSITFIIERMTRGDGIFF